MKKSKLVLSLMLALTLGNSFAGDVLDRVKKTSTINYGYRFAAFPYSFVNKDWNPVGYSYDVCKALHTRLEKSLGTTLNNKGSEVNNQNNIAWIKNGSIDLECGATTQTAERLKQVNAIAIQADNVGIATKSDFKGQSLEDFKGKTIITLAGTTGEKLVRQLNAEKGLNISINLAKDYPQAFLLLGQGRGEAVVSDTLLLKGEIADSDKPSDYKVLNQSLNQLEPIGIVFSKDDTEWANLIKQNMDEIKKSGELEKIYTKWFKSSINPKDINLNQPLTESARKIIFN